MTGTRLRRGRASAPRILTAGVLTAMLLAAVALPDAQALQTAELRHVPPPSVPAWTSVIVTVGIPSGFAEMIVTADAVVQTADGSFADLPLSVSRGEIFGEIPGAVVVPPQLVYFIRIVDANGDILVLPSTAPAGPLYNVRVEGANMDPDLDPPGSGARSGIEILSPLPGKISQTPSPVIAGIIDPALEDPWYAMILLDGRDATTETELTSGTFILIPADTLANGPHRVTFSAITPVRTAERSWTFFVRDHGTGVIEERRRSEAVIAVPPAGEPLDAERWDVMGSAAVGWAAVIADTVTADSLDVLLPYEEASSPTIDIYATAVKGDVSASLELGHDARYTDGLDWTAGLRTDVFEFEAGDIFPSLSMTTLDWASGLGARSSVRVGSTEIELLGMRVSEADTLSGLGLYSRFALGAAGRRDWSDWLTTELIVLSLFDREASVEESERLTDPLRNQVVAGIVRGRRASVTAEFEIAASTAEGEFEGSGGALRARAGWEWNRDRTMAVELTTAGKEFYSAGSLELEPGETAAEIEYAFRVSDRVKTSGWVRLSDGPAETGLTEQEGLGLRSYVRADLAWLGGGDIRSYVVARYDLTPLGTYDYDYAYAATGGTWRNGGTRLGASASWSRSRSPESSETWTLSGDLRRELIPLRWSARAAGRWTLGLAGEETESVRAHYTFETSWRFDRTSLSVEYWLIERDDRVDSGQSYTEHVIAASLGRSF